MKAKMRIGSVVIVVVVVIVALAFHALPFFPSGFLSLETIYKNRVFNHSYQAVHNNISVKVQSSSLNSFSRFSD